MKNLKIILLGLFMVVGWLLYNISIADFVTDWVIQTNNSFKEWTIYSSLNPDGNSISVDTNGDIYMVWSFENGTEWTWITVWWTALVSSGSFDGFLSKVDELWNPLWVKKIGWTSYDRLQSVVVDDNDDVYVMWYFSSTADIFGTSLTSSIWYDIFVAKLNSNWILQWIKQSSGDSSEHANKLSVDNKWNIYLAWHMGSTTTIFWETVSYSWWDDIIVAKLNSQNWNTIWVKTAWWTGGDRWQWVAIDALGNVYVTWYFDDTANIFWTSLTSDTDYYDIFLAKLDSSGDSIWVKQAWGPTLYDKGYNVGVDSNYNVYVSWTYWWNADIFWINKNPSNYSDTFVAKLNALGNTIWVKVAGWSSSSTVNSIIIDKRNNIYITWQFYGNTLFYGIPLLNSWSSDIYIVKLDSSTWDSKFVKSSWWSSSELWNSIISDNKWWLYLIWKFKNTSVNIFWTILWTAWTLQQNEDYFIAKFQDDLFIPTVVGWGKHSCSVLEDGNIKCWGGNYYGQLWDGTRTKRIIPADVNGITNATKVELGLLHSCALLEDSTAKCWWKGWAWELGNGSRNRKLTPVSVLGISDAIDISVGWSHACVVLSWWTVKCWWWNYYGQLWDGTRVLKTTPVTVSGITNAKAIAAGGYHTCALLTDNTVKCWWKWWAGQLGYGWKDRKLTPIAVKNLINVESIALWTNHSCAILTDNTVKCWWNNLSGQIWNGRIRNRTVPTDVIWITNANNISLWEKHSCAVLADNTVKCWWWNYQWQLGLGDQNRRTIPTLVSELSDMRAIWLGWYHSCAVENDNTLKCWGDNEKWQLWDGTTIDRKIPTEVVE